MVNPKIDNLLQGYEAARHDIIWIWDSNVFVDRGCLGRSVDKLSIPNVGLIHHLPCGVSPQTFGSLLEMTFLNTAHAKMYATINFIGVASCVIGKSNLFRKSDLLKVGGLRAFGCYMAEDNMLAQALWDLGYKHETTSDVVYQPLGDIPFIDYLKRRSRWTRIRKYIVRVATLIEPATESILCGLILIFGINVFWDMNPVVVFTLHMIGWFIVDATIFYAIQQKIQVDFKIFILSWIVREITAFPLYLYAIAGSRVNWRGSFFLLKRDGMLIPNGKIFFFFFKTSRLD